MKICENLCKFAQIVQRNDGRMDWQKMLNLGSVQLALDGLGWLRKGSDRVEWPTEAEQLARRPV
jgi:hypothetical protein